MFWSWEEGALRTHPLPVPIYRFSVPVLADRCYEGSDGLWECHVVG